MLPANSQSCASNIMQLCLSCIHCTTAFSSCCPYPGFRLCHYLPSLDRCSPAAKRCTTAQISVNSSKHNRRYHVSKYFFLNKSNGLLQLSVSQIYNLRWSLIASPSHSTTVSFIVTVSSTVSTHWRSLCHRLLRTHLLVFTDCLPHRSKPLTNSCCCHRDAYKSRSLAEVVVLLRIKAACCQPSEM